MNSEVNVMIYIKKIAFAFFVWATFSSVAMASQPFLAFSDLISGPSSGLGDGQGAGVIVTLWGQNLGGIQGNSQVFFTDASGTKRAAAHVYYWKNADGQLPSGPSNLYSPLRMQEIAFSIPADAAPGKGEISVMVNGVSSNVLPFDVRSGQIYFVRSSGSDNSGDGSWKSPWSTVGKATASAPAGSTIYVLDVDTGSKSTARGIYWNDANASSSLASQYSIVAYPGYQPKVMAQRAVENYRTEGMVVSKLDLYASNYTSVDSNGQPQGAQIDSTLSATFGIETSKNGRAVANRITNIPGGCASSVTGAIYGNAMYGDRVSNMKIIGNEIHDYGCNGTSKFQHTTYLSVRSGTGLVVQPWEFAYNYLHDNKAKFGIHQYDEGANCGDVSGPILIHNNVIVNQAGAGINVGSTCGWSMDVYIQKNVLVNVGLAADWNGIDPNTSVDPENGGISIRDSGLLGTMYIDHNLIYKYTSDGQTGGAKGCLALYGNGDNVKIDWNKNVCYTSNDEPFIGYILTANNKLDNISGANNAWYDSGSNSSQVTIPSWDSNPILSDPKLTVVSGFVEVGFGSPLVGSTPLTSSLTASAAGSSTDVYGVATQSNTYVGPAIYRGPSPSPPSDISVH